MGRWLAPLLPGPQHWVLHDRDADLLALAAVDVPAGVTVEPRLGDVTQLEPDDLAGATLVTASALMALPYLLLRLVADFSFVPGWLMRAAEAGLILSVVTIFVVPGAIPGWFAAALIIYFLAIEGYAAVKFVQEARHANGVTSAEVHRAITLVLQAV